MNSLSSSVKWLCKAFKKTLESKFLSAGSLPFVRTEYFHYIFHNTPLPHGKGCVPVTSGPCKTAHKSKNESAAAIVEDWDSNQESSFHYIAEMISFWSLLPTSQTGFYPSLLFSLWTSVCSREVSWGSSQPLFCKSAKAGSLLLFLWDIWVSLWNSSSQIRCQCLHSPSLSLWHLV